MCFIHSRDSAMKQKSILHDRKDRRHAAVTNGLFYDMKNALSGLYVVMITYKITLSNIRA